MHNVSVCELHKKKVMDSMVKYQKQDDLTLPKEEYQNIAQSCKMQSVSEIFVN